MATTQVLEVARDTWPSFASYLLRRCDRFVSEQREAWSALRELADSVQTLEEPGDLASGRTLAEAAALFERAGQGLLVAPYKRCGLLRPLPRSLNAIENLDREASSHAGSAEYMEGLRRVTLHRARIDGAIQLLLCQTCLRLGERWSAYLAKEVGRDKRPKEGVPEPSGETLSTPELERAQADRILERYRRWTEDALIYVNLHRDRPRPKEALVRKHERHLDFWRGRQGLVAGILAVETGIWKAGKDCLRATDSVVGELKAEGHDLRRRLRALIQYLERWTSEPFDPPEIAARIAGPEERIETWQSRMERILREILPESLEVPQPRSALPSLLERSRQTRPGGLYLRALRYEALPVLEEQFRSRILFHREIAASLVRAQEVVRYALEASPERPSPLVAEALRNAQSLLREYDESKVWDAKELETSIVRALLLSVYEVVALVRSGRMGVAALIARQIRLQFTEPGRASAKRSAQSLLHSAVEALARRSGAMLVGIGWNDLPRASVPPVRVRTELRGPSLASAREQSLLYSRLFELKPVEDHRFLVGREAEIEGFRQAYQAWRRGRFAACVMVGSPGSGKTSLLSCAIPQIVEKEPVLQCEIQERLSTPQTLESSMRSLLNIPDRLSLVEGIRTNPQLIVLEGLERAFLKTVGGFEAMRALVDLIDETASSALWIVVINARCFALLDAALELDRFFSHRINALGVPAEVLERAILQRHYLSGLKLSYAEVRPSRLHTGLGWREDPQKAFFALLHRHSGGNFRSALELWQTSIVSADGGVVRMGEPEGPNFRQVRQELGKPDEFTLLSVEQHGSLTVSELARVLLEPDKVSRTHLERLTRMGLLEKNSDKWGFRVRPQARHAVEEVLRSVNLI